MTLRMVNVSDICVKLRFGVIKSTKTQLLTSDFYFGFRSYERARRNLIGSVYSILSSLSIFVKVFRSFFKNDFWTIFAFGAGKFSITKPSLLTIRSDFQIPNSISLVSKSYASLNNRFLLSSRNTKYSSIRAIVIRVITKQL